MTQDDLLYRFRLRTFAMAAELGNVRAACRAMGIHPSTYYRWKRQLTAMVRRSCGAGAKGAADGQCHQPLGGAAGGRLRAGPSRLWAGPDRRRAGQGQVGRDCPVDQWGVAGAAPPRPQHPRQRYGLVAGYAAPPEPQRPAPPPERHLDVEHPGQLVQLDCFCIGRLSGTKGTVWQYTAIDVASAYAWETLQVTRRNPSAVWTSQLARTVAAELAKHGWKLERVMSDNASKFRSATFGQTITQLGAGPTFIRAGRPQTNSCVERVQQTILEECWKPAFARYLIPK